MLVQVCVWSDWEPWGACLDCGERRERQLMKWPRADAAPCAGHAVEQRGCACSSTQRRRRKSCTFAPWTVPADRLLFPSRCVRWHSVAELKVTLRPIQFPCIHADARRASCRKYLKQKLMPDLDCSNNRPCDIPPGLQIGNLTRR